jgi:hypothetical protein
MFSKLSDKVIFKLEGRVDLLETAPPNVNLTPGPSTIGDGSSSVER